MVAPSLPSELRAALQARLEGRSRNEVAARADNISRNYRGGGGSGIVASEADALAYALARMPATYAAVAASLNAAIEAAPEFAPATLLDIGAGPGTASFAAAEAFPSLCAFALLDANGALRALALELAQNRPRLSRLHYAHGEARRLVAAAEPADLVIASYMIGELTDVARSELAALMWGRTRQTLLVVEPGTPAGYARVIALRAQLIALGAHVAAPCPHDGACPLTPPDWCHFSQRLPRSRAHKAIKDADAPFEDERFAYVVLTRGPRQASRSRVLASPSVGKAEVAAELCTPEGVAVVKVPRRDKTAYAVARRWRWGDAVQIGH